MEIDNEPIISGNEYAFCERHNAAAHAFLKEAHKAVKFAGVRDAGELLSNVHKSLVVLLWTREGCKDCGEAYKSQRTVHTG